MKKLTFLFFALSLLLSCEKSNAPELIIDFNPPVLDQYDIVAIDFDNKGNAWAGTFNAHWPGDVNSPKLIRYNIETGSTTIWDTSNSLLRDSAFIWDITVDRNDNIWIGSESLIRFDGEVFTRFGVDNSDLPSNHVTSIVEDSQGNIWFSSGGLVKFNGMDFTVYTPDNSDLPLNIVGALAIDGDDNIWAAQDRYLDESCLARLSGETISVYTGDDLGFIPAYWGDVEMSKMNSLWCSVDYTLSYSSYNPRPQVILFDGKECELISFDDHSSIRELAVDHDGNLWGQSNDLVVAYNGTDWVIDSLTLKDRWASAIEVSKDNRIWLGTSTGILISR
ncbi:MAG: two-component regulator propeller domain-containing protein [Bacteroidales bacterium]|nr:two-component regulator propeller domain-containing protein [Bacteroidales bacterium]